MKQVRGTISQGDPTCLHCVVDYAIGSWAKRSAPRNEDGEIVLDMGLVIAKIAEVLGQHIHASPDPEVQAKFERYAHECLEAAFEHQRTGKVMMVSVNHGPAS